MRALYLFSIFIYFFGEKYLNKKYFVKIPPLFFSFFSKIELFNIEANTLDKTNPKHACVGAD